MASGDTCPPASELVYSPFTPFSQAEYFAYNQKTDNACWWWIICLLSSADEARKKQFDATSLVMGLVPLTLKDIAWPERRLVRVSRRLPPLSDMIVRALGVVPSITKVSFSSSSPEGRQATMSPVVASTSLYAWTEKLSYHRSVLLVAVSTLGLAIAYAALAVMELYSKRSSLGCVYPIFILTWHLLALVPASLEIVLPRTLTKRAAPHPVSEALPQQPAHDSSSSSVDVTSRIERHEHSPTATTTNNPLCQPGPAPSTDAGTESGIQDQIIARATKRPNSNLALTVPEGPTQSFPDGGASPIQGRGKAWLVQFVWAIYYIAGTLVYTSITGVTVIELFVWVVVSIAVTVASKFLAFFLCLAMERRWRGTAMAHRD